MARRITLDFLKTESASGAILATAALVAIVMANSPADGLYFRFLEAPFTIQIGGFAETHPVLDWVKEGLMAIFFFVVGLEIKYEVLKGELANPRRLALPIFAALGGMAVPALIYLALNAGAGGAPQGWPTPVATDIAFAIAALAVAGPRLPPALRIFLLTLAIVDDLGAVAIIGAVFTTHVRVAALTAALAALALMGLMGRWRQAPYLFYALGFLIVWGFTFKSGISTSVAGVAAAMTIPVEPRKPGRPGVLQDFMESLHPYVAYLILPLFAFCAAGFDFGRLSLDDLFGPVSLGVALGLFLGKPLGVFGAIALLTGLKIARRPMGAKWVELFGVSLLTGIGFTMSLFIGALAFPGAGPEQGQVRAGVIMGSVLSTLAGSAVLAWAQARRKAEG
ncbi:Na+/H+ antiporter NhaA [Phenylobacterium soli]|uniref:Na(+)/H(+) antiporter NhaA n=1 Tax=Phenylobacterium soli TaxID=2170551 RepID=A0A328AHR4_9CAUL|nr:Na+/H+ antiporter NhaA [Phenylobacterium soli]RAK54055.1 Na+/H+ antiporter NhaA [Phenylobacterium soli]